MLRDSLGSLNWLRMIPGLVETFTRPPVGIPYFTGSEDSDLLVTVAIFFVLLLIGAGLQVCRLRTELGASKRLPEDQ